VAAANTLQWAIAQSRMPPHLKNTCNALALVADPCKGYANIRLSKHTIGRYTSKSDRIAREDMADLVRFGVLTVVQQSRGGPGCATVYQLWFDRVVNWSAADTAALLNLRRARRDRPNGKTRIRRAGLLHSNSDVQPGSGDPYNPDPAIRTTRIRGSGDVRTEISTEVRSTSAVDRQQPAAPPAAALAAQPVPGSRGSSAAFHLLSEVGRRLLAGNGPGPVEWGWLRSELRAAASRLGIAHRVDGDLLASIEDSLQRQREHFLASPDRVPAPPPPIDAVRPAGEALS
jgi:hypothetical protein